MNAWKEAFKLMAFEFKQSRMYTMVVFTIILVLALLFVLPSLPSYFESGFLGMDLFFYIILTMAAIWMKPKDFQIQKLQDDLWGSHIVVMMNTFPIQRNVIVKYRFLAYWIPTLLFNIVFLILMYVFSPILQSQMRISTFLVFVIFWLSFSMIIECMYPIFDAGFKPTPTVILTVSITLVLVIPLITLFYHVYTDGFIHWTIYIANHYPLLTCVLSVFSAIICFFFAMKVMSRKIRKKNYL